MMHNAGVVGCGEGFGYLTSPLILASRWARSAILVAGKVEGEYFLFLLFLHFHSCSSSFPVPSLSSLLSLLSLFSVSLGDNTK